MENKGISALPQIKIAWPLILKSLPFVSHRPACTMALCEQESPVQGLPARGPPLPTGGLRAGPALLLDVIQEPLLGGGSPERKTNRARSSGKCWVLELAGTVPAFPSPEPALCPPASCGSELAVPGRGLGTRTFPPKAWESRADTPGSADRPFRAFTLNTQDFSCPTNPGGETVFPGGREKLSWAVASHLLLALVAQW